jgi:hypothetical protein
MEKRLLSLNEMAKELRVTVGWLRRRALDGMFPVEPARPDGGGMAFDAEAVWARMRQVSGYSREGCSAVQLVGTREAAAELGVHPSILIRRAQEGRVPHYVIGNRYAFNLDVVCNLDFFSQLKSSIRADSAAWCQRVGIPPPEPTSGSPARASDEGVCS